MVLTPTNGLSHQSYLILPFPSDGVAATIRAAGVGLSSFPALEAWFGSIQDPHQFRDQRWCTDPAIGKRHFSFPSALQYTAVGSPTLSMRKLLILECIVETSHSLYMSLCIFDGEMTYIMNVPKITKNSYQRVTLYSRAKEQKSWRTKWGREACINSSCEAMAPTRLLWRNTRVINYSAPTPIS